jgi:tetratricopeptide (TPR) repeat protein
VPAELGPLKTRARETVEPLRFDTPARRTVHNLPFPPNPAFTGRDADMKRLGKLLKKRREVKKRGEITVVRSVVLHGLGGVGKTQLAVQYAWKYLREFDAVLWARADSPEALEASLADLASVLRLPEAKEREQAVQTQAVLDWLNNHERWLLIVDNADTDAAKRAVLERLSPRLTGHVLITSRISDWPVNIRDMALDLLSPDDARRYLLDRIARKGHNAGGDAAARALAQELGHLPLALEQAASFIVEMRWSFAKYQEQFRYARLELLSERREGGTRYAASVAKTWGITLEKLSPLTRAILRMAAWFAPDAIPREIFSANKELLSEVLTEEATVSDLAIEKALGELDRFSLVRLTSKTVSVHRLLQAVERDALAAEERERWLLYAVQLFNAFAPWSYEVLTWSVWMPLAPHAETLLGHSKEQGIDAPPPVALTANQLGLFLYARAAYAAAEPLYERALAIYEKALGPVHPEVAASLNYLAELYQVQGRYAEAESLYERALVIYEEALGPAHSDVAASLNNLAELYRAQGRYAEAEPLYKRALGIWEQALGPEHHYVSASLNNLGACCHDQGQYGKAEPLYERALAIRKKALGPEHPEVGRSLSNLALLYGTQGQYGKAEPLYRRALAILEKALGPEHPDVAESLNNLALLYGTQGQYGKAEPLYRRALAIREKALGLDHPNVAACLENYAALLRSMGRPEKAEQLESRAEAIRAKHA